MNIPEIIIINGFIAPIQIRKEKTKRHTSEVQSQGKVQVDGKHPSSVLPPNLILDTKFVCQILEIFHLMGSLKLSWYVSHLVSLFYGFCWHF